VVDFVLDFGAASEVAFAVGAVLVACRLPLEAAFFKFDDFDPSTSAPGVSAFLDSCVCAFKDWTGAEGDPCGFSFLSLSVEEASFL